MIDNNQNNPTENSKDLHNTEPHQQESRADETQEQIQGSDADQDKGGDPSLNKDEINSKMEDRAHDEAEGEESDNKRPLTDANEAIERENQGSAEDQKEHGSSGHEADFENPKDDPA